MRKFRLFAILGAVLTIAVAPSDSGGGNAVAASASGGYGFSGTAVGSTFVIHPFTFNVQMKSDGSVTGHYNYRQLRDGVELTVEGSLTCAVIVGNRAWVGGIIEKSSRESLVGLDMWFQVQDNGEPGSDEVPDMSTTIGADAPGTGQQYCDDAPEPRFPFFLSQGNIQVRS